MFSLPLVSKSSWTRQRLIENALVKFAVWTNAEVECGLGVAEGMLKKEKLSHSSIHLLLECLFFERSFFVLGQRKNLKSINSTFQPSRFFVICQRSTRISVFVISMKWLVSAAIKALDLEFIEPFLFLLPFKRNSHSFLCCKNYFTNGMLHDLFSHLLRCHCANDIWESESDTLR